MLSNPDRSVIASLAAVVDATASAGDAIARRILEQAADALKELLNVTTGDYLHELEGNEPIFDLAAPALTALDRVEFKRQWAGRPQVTLNVEGQPLWLGFGS